MQIKITCSCATRFAFEVEPVDGHMPSTVACPRCGADATEQAERQIQAACAEAPTLAEVAPAVALPEAVPPPPPPEIKKPGLSVHRTHAPTPSPAAASPSHAPTPTPSPSSGGGIKLGTKHKHEQPEAKPETEAAAVPDGSIGGTCSKHPNDLTTHLCFVCQKPICQKCMEIFGFLCSARCRHDAEVKGLKVPKCEAQKSVVEAKLWGKVARIAAVIAVILGGLFGAYGWYYFVGSRPSLEYSIASAGGGGDEDDDRGGRLTAKFVGADQVAVFNGKTLSVHDVKTKKALWSKDLDSSGGGGRGRFFSSGGLHVAGGRVWLQTGRQVTCYDAQTGEEKQSVAIKGYIEDFDLSDKLVTIVANSGPDRSQITRIALPDGKPETQDVITAPMEQVAVKKDLSAAPPTARALLNQELNDPTDFLAKNRTQLIAAGSNVAEVNVKLVKKNMVAKKVMKDVDPRKSRLNAKTGVTSNVGAIMEDLSNEIKMSDTGGMDTFDESTYEVTVKRRMGEGGTWSKQVIGPPSFFSAETVDIVTANTKVYLLDKQNKLITESTLSFPVDESYGRGYGGFSRPGRADQPCVQVGDTLYLFDKGVLTAFSLPSGEVKWRLTSVGISQIEFDSKGMLYVKSTTAAPESIQFYEQVNLTDKPRPILLKVDPASGKILWKTERWGDRMFVEGKHLYVARTQGGMSGDGDHFRIYKLKPGSGDEVWEYYRNETPHDVQFAGNRILLVLDKEVRVMKYLSL